MADPKLPTPAFLSRVWRNSSASLLSRMEGKMYRHAYRRAPVRLTVVAGAMALSGCMIGPSMVEVSRLSLPDGSYFALEQAPGPRTILLQQTSSGVTTTPIDMLAGVSGLSLPFGGAKGQDTILVAEGSTPDCQVRTVLLQPMPGSVRQFRLPTCDQHYRIVQQAPGNVNAIVIGQTAPPYAVFLFANGALVGPIVGRATPSAARQHNRRAARPQVARPTGDSAPPEATQPAAGWVAPVPDSQ